MSINAYGHACAIVSLLRSGGAAGFGVGPIIVSTSKREVGGRIAIPATDDGGVIAATVGTLRHCRDAFDQIEDAVLRGESIAAC